SLLGHLSGLLDRIKQLLRLVLQECIRVLENVRGLLLGLLPFALDLLLPGAELSQLLLIAPLFLLGAALFLRHLAQSPRGHICLALGPLRSLLGLAFGLGRGLRRGLIECRARILAEVRRFASRRHLAAGQRCVKNFLFATNRHGYVSLSRSCVVAPYRRAGVRLRRIVVAYEAGCATGRRARAACSAMEASAFMRSISIWFAAFSRSICMSAAAFSRASSISAAALRRERSISMADFSRSSWMVAALACMSMSALAFSISIRACCISISGLGFWDASCRM